MGELPHFYKEYIRNLLIIWELRDFTAAGILEYWNTGMMEDPNKRNNRITEQTR